MSEISLLERRKSPSWGRTSSPGASVRRPGSMIRRASANRREADLAAAYELRDQPMPGASLRHGRRRYLRVGGVDRPRLRVGARSGAAPRFDASLPLAAG